MAIHELNNNPTLAGQVRLIENVVYGAADGEAQQMSLLTPWAQRYQAAQLPARPLIVFVQGALGAYQPWGKKFPNWSSLFTRATWWRRFNTGIHLMATPFRPF